MHFQKTVNIFNEWLFVYNVYYIPTSSISLYKLVDESKYMSMSPYQYTCTCDFYFEACTLKGYLHNNSYAITIYSVVLLIFFNYLILISNYILYYNIISS